MHPSGKQIQNPIENEPTNLFRFDDDGFVVVLLHVRQRFRQDAGLILWADGDRQIGHGGLAERAEEIRPRV